MSNGNYDNNNIFAQILSGKLPCKKVYDDESVLVFHDKYPDAPVHILAVPKKNRMYRMMILLLTHPQMK